MIQGKRYNKMICDLNADYFYNIKRFSQISQNFFLDSLNILSKTTKHCFAIPDQGHSLGFLRKRERVLSKEVLRQFLPLSPSPLNLLKTSTTLLFLWKSVCGMGGWGYNFPPPHHFFTPSKVTGSNGAFWHSLCRRKPPLPPSISSGRVWFRFTPGGIFLIESFPWSKPSWNSLMKKASGPDWMPQDWWHQQVHYVQKINLPIELTRSIGLRLVLISGMDTR